MPAIPLRTLLTLDYEVFFGPRTGSVERCLLAPTDALLSLAARHGVPLVFFVDAGFLLRLRELGARHAVLSGMEAAVRRQLDRVVRLGHELQLHVHPHWEDARWTAQGWDLARTRYALHAFSSADIAALLQRYANGVREIAGPGAAFAYRAGGWVLQPFERLREPLWAAGVRVDSTVFAGGLSRSLVQPFDFRGAPARSRWRFDADPLREDPAGRFLEVPIASHVVGAAFYWSLALARRLGGRRHRAFGDGQPIAMEKRDALRKLLRPTPSVVSLDGLKARFLAAAARRYRAAGLEDFVVLGHPKALTPDGLACLDRFLAARTGGDVVTYSAYADELHGRSGHDPATHRPDRRRAA